MKKIIICLFSLISLLTLASCNEIRETINEIKKLAIEEAVGSLTTELGMENFELPECKTLDLQIEYEKEVDKSEIEIKIVEPICTIDEFKDDLVTYVEDAFKEEIGVDAEFEPEKTDDGYKWSYNLTRENENGDIVDVKIEIILSQDEDGFDLDFDLYGLGDISELIAEEIQKIKDAGNQK